MFMIVYAILINMEHLGVGVRDEVLPKTTKYVIAISNRSSQNAHQLLYFMYAKPLVDICY